MLRFETVWFLALFPWIESQSVILVDIFVLFWPLEKESMLVSYPVFKNQNSGNALSKCSL